MRSFPVLALLFGAIATQDGAPRRLTPTTINIPGDLATVSGVRELRDGRLLVSDAKRALVLLVDPASGASKQLSSAGGDSIQYAQPGGFYSGPGDSTFLLDRGLARFLVISPSGAIVTSRSIKRRGTSSSSDADVDFQRVDAHGLAYFADRAPLGRLTTGATMTDSAILLRFDAARQHADTVARLRRREERVTQVAENMTMSQQVIGSPEDGWGVTSDGRVAVVRASPYRVEWRSSGSVVRGPEIAVEMIPFTAAEKDSISAASTKHTASIGMVGAPAASTANQTRLFAATKAPFDARDVFVSPDGRVWVARTRAAGTAVTRYDVFDGHGDRVDRIELPAVSRVIGFGKNAIYAVERDSRGIVYLRKYKLS